MQDNATSEDERDQYFGLSLRELLRTFKWQTLVMLKAMLLQPKVRSAGSLEGLDSMLTKLDALLWLPL